MMFGACMVHDTNMQQIFSALLSYLQFIYMPILLVLKSTTELPMQGTRQSFDIRFFNIIQLFAIISSVVILQKGTQKDLVEEEVTELHTVKQLLTKLQN